jgi:N-acetylated-alpha-linked acidic dipeptidase
VYSEWRRAGAVADTAEPAMGDPGGGSDFAGFYNHLGIPIAEWGFGGAGGVYHSQYDSYAWMTKFGDTDFQYHAAAARIGTAMLLRIANADILPYDYVEYARTVRRYIAPIDSAVSKRHWNAQTTSLRTSIDRLEREAAAFSATRDSTLAGSVATATLQRANRALMQVERALIRPQGLRSRPWFRNLIYVADENNGYANMAMPSVNEAIRASDEALTRTEIEDLASRFERAAQSLVDARTALRSR